MPQENYNILQHFASIPGMQDMLKKKMQMTAGLKELPYGGFLNAAHAAQRATDQFPSDNYQMGNDDNFYQWLGIDHNLRPEQHKQRQAELALQNFLEQAMPSVEHQRTERKWNPQIQ